MKVAVQVAFRTASIPLIFTMQSYELFLTFPNFLRTFFVKKEDFFEVFLVISNIVIIFAAKKTNSKYEDSETAYHRGKESEGTTHTREADETQKAEEKIPVLEEY